MELIIGLLLSLMTAFASSASLESDLCDEGESFWCQSIENAAACGAVNHCKETVWKNVEMKEEWSLSKASPLEKCRACQQFFSSLQSQLRNNKEEYMHAVKASLPLVLKLSLQFQDYAMICQQLTMCELAKDYLDLHDIGLHIDKIQDNNNCSICRSVMNFLAKQNISAVIETTLTTYLCQEMCAFRAFCKLFVNVLVPQVSRDLISFLNSTICTDIRYCHDSKESEAHSQQQQRLKHHQQQGEYERHLAARKPNTETTVCHLCHRVLEKTIESETINETATTFLTAMRKICDSLRWPIKGDCHRMVDAIDRPSLEKPSLRFNPAAVCQMLGLCDRTSNVKGVSVIKDIVGAVASEGCSICQSTTGYLAVLLRQERPVNEVKVQVKRICQFLQFAMDEAECESVVDKYNPLFFDSLVDDLSRDNFCQRASLCSGSTTDGDNVNPTTLEVIQPDILELWPRIRCLRGSPFWCANVENAKLCQMEQYCEGESK